MLEYVDFGPNPHVESFGRFGSLQVRWAKGTKGSGPRRRTVLTVPEFDWVVGLLEYWLSPDGRKRFPTADRSASLWPPERSGSTVLRNFDRSFQRVRKIAGLPEELSLHTLRHSYVTHLIEAGYDPLFIQQQVGHSYSSTTALYTSVSHPNSNWVFRGGSPGRHLRASTLTQRLSMAFSSRAARLGTLHELTKLAPVAIIAEALGYSPATIDRHALASSANYMEYVNQLADGHDDQACIAFELPVSKSTSTHNFRILREAGIIEQRYSGTAILNTLRSDVLDRLFPGLLTAIIAAERSTAMRAVSDA